MRKASWGESKQSILDKIIEQLRFYRIRRHIKPGVSILDLGCGYNAKLLKNLKNQFKIRVGIDLNVNGSIKNVILINGRVDKKIKLASNKFDTITALALAEHVEYPKVMYKETYRLLKKNGQFIMTTPSSMSKPLLEFLAYKLKIISIDEIMDHKRYYDKKSLKLALIESGFKQKNISIKYFQLGLNIIAITKK